MLLDVGGGIFGQFPQLLILLFPQLVGVSFSLRLIGLRFDGFAFDLKSAVCTIFQPGKRPNVVGTPKSAEIFGEGSRTLQSRCATMTNDNVVCNELDLNCLQFLLFWR